MNESLEIGTRIRELRTSRGRTQDELADLLKVNKSAISRIESGERGIAVQELAVIAPFLDVSVDEVVYGDAAGKDTVLLRADGDSTEAVSAATKVIEDFEYLEALTA